MADLRTMEGVRVRIQRMKDARFFGGWLLNASGNVIIIRLTQKVTFFSGDEIVIEMMGYESALVKAVCVSAVGDVLTANALSQPIMTAGREPMRMLTHSMRGRIIVRSIAYPITVNDVGLEGLGIYCERSFDKGDACVVELNASSGTIQAEAQVRSATVAEDPLLGYKIGLMLTQLDGKSAARWHEMFRRAA